MWTYEQSTGWLIAPDGSRVSQGYSGAGEGKNNPAMQNVPDEGPIPQGRYTIGEPHDSAMHGPFVMTLTPFADDEMFGRAGFLMHGDSIPHPGTASEGCIIQPRAVRERVWASGDHELEVVATYADNSPRSSTDESDLWSET